MQHRFFGWLIVAGVKLVEGIPQKHDYLLITEWFATVMLAYEHDMPYSTIFSQYGATFLGLVNKRGRTLISPNQKLSLDDRKKEMFFMSSALINNMYQDFDDDFGSLEYCVAERKNQKFISIPTLDGILLAAMPKEKDHEMFITTLKQVQPPSCTPDNKLGLSMA